jgi:site-specific recombinase XerD
MATYVLVYTIPKFAFLKQTLYTGYPQKQHTAAIQNFIQSSCMGSVRGLPYLFEGHNGEALSQRGSQWVIAQAVKKAGILKEASLHTLRHTYATHLLEQGVNILTIKALLGHAHIETTMVYLHLARPSANLAFSPMDTLYKQAK